MTTYDLLNWLNANSSSNQVNPPTQAQARDYAEANGDGNPNQITFNHPVTGERITTFRPPYFRGLVTTGAWSTALNRTYGDYNFLALISSYYFMGDIDSETIDIAQIKKDFPDFLFRFYKTYKGFRFFILNHEFVLQHKLVHNIFTKTNCDINYQNMYWQTRRFAARLSPKVRFETQVAELIHSDAGLFDFNSGVLLDVSLMLTYHDAFCLDTSWPRVFYDNYLKQDLKQGNQTSDEEGVLF